MSRTLHPSELAQILQNRLVAKSATIGLLALSCILLSGAVRSPDSRVWLFGGTLGTAILARLTHRIAIDAERQFDDSKDISLTNWQNQFFKRTRDGGLTLEGQILPTEPDRLPLFDWSELSDSDQYPVLAIIAPMGGGKSRLVKYLGKYVLFDKQPNIVAFDIYARKQDWENAATEYDQMLKVMESDLKEIDDRKLKYRSGENSFSPQLRVLEEAVDTLPNIKRSVKPQKKSLIVGSEFMFQLRES